MIVTNCEELNNYFLFRTDIKQDEECEQIASDICLKYNIKVLKVYGMKTSKGIGIIIDTKKIISLEQKKIIRNLLEVHFTNKYVEIELYFEACLMKFVDAFSEVLSWDKSPYFLPQAIKIFKAKGYEINFEHIYNRQYELNIFYKNRWKLKKAIKDGSAEALRDSILEVLAKYDKKNMFNKDNFPINFCNMRKYNMFVESRG